MIKETLIKIITSVLFILLTIFCVECLKNGINNCDEVNGKTCSIYNLHNN